MRKDEMLEVVGQWETMWMDRGGGRGEEVERRRTLHPLKPRQPQLMDVVKYQYSVNDGAWHHVVTTHTHTDLVHPQMYALTHHFAKVPPRLFIPLTSISISILKCLPLFYVTWRAAPCSAG